MVNGQLFACMLWPLALFLVLCPLEQHPQLTVSVSCVVCVYKENGPEVKKEAGGRRELLLYRWTCKNFQGCFMLKKKMIRHCSLMCRHSFVAQ